MRLRRKLGLDTGASVPKRGTIEAVRGFGYRYMAPRA
jgi:DNA-binding response OmpR family regulator